MATTETLTINPTEAPIVDAEIIDTPIVQSETKNEKNHALKLINNEGEVNLLAMTPEDKAKYDKIASSLQVKDVNSVINYGADVQSVLSSYSREFLGAVSTSKAGEMGDRLLALRNEFTKVNVNEVANPSVITKVLRKVPILRHLVLSVENLKNKYDNIENNINAIAKEIAATGLGAQRDNNALQVQFDNNVHYISLLEERIIAGKMKEEELKNQLNDMLAHADDYQPYEISDVQNYIVSLDKRLYDMLSIRQIMIKSLSEIRLVQANNAGVAQNAMTIQTMTIPVWRGQISTAIAMQNTEKRIALQRSANDFTNEMLLSNAELLDRNSREVAKEMERGVVDIETLRKTTESFIKTVTEVKAIHDKAIAERAINEREIINLGKELDKSLTSLSTEMNSTKLLTSNE